MHDSTRDGRVRDRIKAVLLASGGWSQGKYDMRGFVLNQISSKKIGVDESKVEKIIEQVNTAVLDASQYTDWEVKSNFMHS